MTVNPHTFSSYDIPNIANSHVTVIHFIAPVTTITTLGIINHTDVRTLVMDLPAQGYLNYARSEILAVNGKASIIFNVVDSAQANQVAHDIHTQISRGVAVSTVAAEMPANLTSALKTEVDLVGYSNHGPIASVAGDIRQAENDAHVQKPVFLEMGASSNISQENQVQGDVKIWDNAQRMGTSIVFSSYQDIAPRSDGFFKADGTAKKSFFEIQHRWASLSGNAPMNMPLPVGGFVLTAFAKSRKKLSTDNKEEDEAFTDALAMIPGEARDFVEKVRKLLVGNIKDKLIGLVLLPEAIVVIVREAGREQKLLGKGLSWDDFEKMHLESDKANLTTLRSKLEIQSISGWAFWVSVMRHVKNNLWWLLSGEGGLAMAKLNLMSNSRPGTKDDDDNKGNYDKPKKIAAIMALSLFAAMLGLWGYSNRQTVAQKNGEKPTALKKNNVLIVLSTSETKITAPDRGAAKGFARTGNIGMPAKPRKLNLFRIRNMSRKSYSASLIVWLSRMAWRYISVTFFQASFNFTALSFWVAWLFVRSMNVMGVLWQNGCLINVQWWYGWWFVKNACSLFALYWWLKGCGLRVRLITVTMTITRIILKVTPRMITFYVVDLLQGLCRVFHAMTLFVYDISMELMTSSYSYTTIV